MAGSVTSLRAAMKIMKNVRFSVEYEGSIEYDTATGEDMQVGISGIDIPEGGKNKVRYKANTFRLLDVSQPVGYRVPSIHTEEPPCGHGVGADRCPDCDDETK